MPPSKAATTARPSTGANPNKSALHSVRIGLPPASETNRSCNTIFSDPGPRCTYPFEKSGLKVKLPARNIAWYRDPAAILIDQLKEIWIDAELETVETANWVPKLMRKDFTVAMSLSGRAVDDPDNQFYENYSCRSPRNYTGCNPELDALIDRQSAESDPARRRELVWQIERKLIEDAVRPIIFFMRQGTCWQPEVKGLTLRDNSIFNSWRMEDVGSTADARPSACQKPM